MNNEDRVLLENMFHMLKALLEGKAAFASVPGDIVEIKERIINLENSDKAMRAAITDQTGQLNNHETRIVRLEQSPA